MLKTGVLVVALFLFSSNVLAQVDTCDSDVVEISLPYFGPADVVDECVTLPLDPIHTENPEQQNPKTKTL